MSYDTINSETNNVMIRGHSSENDALLVHNSRPASVGSINDRPLFGESRREKVLSNGLIFAIIVLLSVAVLTLVFIQFKFVNFLAIAVIVSLAASHVLLIYWYRQGDLDPKFRRKIFWDSLNLCLFCVVVILYYFNVNGSSTRNVSTF